MAETINKSRPQVKQVIRTIKSEVVTINNMKSAIPCTKGDIIISTPENINLHNVKAHKAEAKDKTNP